MHSILLITTTVGAFSQWPDTPTTVALVFALAGTFYLGIYALRRLRQRSAPRGKSHDLVRLPI
jgi:flagellar biogenesis protein FliO